MEKGFEEGCRLRGGCRGAARARIEEGEIRIRRGRGVSRVNVRRFRTTGQGV